MKTFLAIAITLALRGISSAQTTAMDLYTECPYAAANPIPTEHEVEASLCIGYLKGVSDTVKVTGPSIQVCVPDDVTPRQVVLVMVKYLKDHPEMLNEKQIVITLLALKAAWPCKVQPSGGG